MFCPLPLIGKLYVGHPTRTAPNDGKISVVPMTCEFYSSGGTDETRKGMTKVMSFL